MQLGHVPSWDRDERETQGAVCPAGTLGVPREQGRIPPLGHRRRRLPLIWVPGCQVPLCPAEKGDKESAIPAIIIPEGDAGPAGGAEQG